MTETFNLFIRTADYFAVDNQVFSSVKINVSLLCAAQTSEQNLVLRLSPAYHLYLLTDADLPALR